MSLVPTRVVNKNGVQTTVYKKAAEQEAAPVVLPSPVMATNSRSIHELALSLMDDLRDVNRRIDEEDMDGVADRLGSLDRDYLEILERAVSRSEKAGEVVLHLLVFDTDHDVVKTAAHFIPELPEAAWTGSSSLVRGLSRYEQLSGYSDHSTSEESVQSQCLALIKVASSLEHHNFTSYVESPADTFPVVYEHTSLKSYRYIRDASLVELILERPEDADRMARIIEEQGSISANTMRGLLEGSSSAFASGTL